MQLVRSLKLSLDGDTRKQRAVSNKNALFALLILKNATNKRERE